MNGRVIGTEQLVGCKQLQAGQWVSLEVGNEGWKRELKKDGGRGEVREEEMRAQQMQ